ncbi:unnamed protein product [Blepharisma stoltei]|uniref:non-specific serine/threonine protein kinase n=1 Tax=Blepharisma stoltei TaxID=1481888 RepID=A0AAU9KET4_9CILI|nr:unnamed protein product [Blepharisma stoltei]
MDPDFVVYDTTEVAISRNPQGRKVIECLNDGSKFILEKTIGRGCFSKVKQSYRIFRDENGNEEQAIYAIKKMHKPTLKKQRCVLYDSTNTMKMANNWEKVKTEISIWRTLCHPNIIRLYEVIDDRNHDYVYLVIEYADCGQIMKWKSDEQRYELNNDVVGWLREKYPEVYEKFDEREATAKIIFSQVAQGVEYLQNPTRNVIHKDLKPDNILFCSMDCNAKLTDFTISQKLETPETLCYNPPGTTPFQAPESMFSGNGFSGQKSDVWAMGICMYAMMSGGFLPFWSNESEIQTQLSIQNQELTLHESFSDDFKDLLLKILTKNPDERISIQEILTHRWLNIKN